MDLNINKYTRNQQRNVALKTSGNVDAIQKNFEILNEKIDYAAKQLNAWDFYRITQTISSEDEYQAKINALLPNTAAIVTSKLGKANIGDIFFKQSDYTVQQITAERGGIFYPSLISQVAGTNTYQISFTFLSSEPVSGEVSKAVGAEVTEPMSKITFTDLTSSSGANNYGEILIPSSGSVTSGHTKIGSYMPIFKSYNANNEEVYWDFTVSIDNNHFVINNIPSIVSYIIMK